MYCPSCGTEQPPGVACIACGRPFRRQQAPPAAPRRLQRYQRRGVGARLLGCTTTLVAALVVVLAVAAFATREPARAPGPAEGGSVGLAPVASATAVPVPAATVPSGAGAETLVVTEAELNRWLAAYATELRPASDPRAEIDAEGIAVHVRVYGLGATYRARPAVADGRLVLEDSRVEGPLGIAFRADDVTARLQAALDERLATAGKRVAGIELAPGVLRVTLEPAEG
jgi:hypothetical protein